MSVFAHNHSDNNFKKAKSVLYTRKFVDVRTFIIEIQNQGWKDASLTSAAVTSSLKTACMSIFGETAVFHQRSSLVFKFSC